jgi:RNA polymerase sigma-70 factor, ECF subfamily
MPYLSRRPAAEFPVRCSTLVRVTGAVRDDQQITGWALAAGAGDRDAAEAFVRATQRDVWLLVAHLTDGYRADDLTQETYLRALGSLPRFAGRSSARTWLLSIARRVVVDHIRHRYRQPRAVGGDWVRAADQHQLRERELVPGFEDIVETDRLLAGLDPARREALVLTQICGLDYAEAAAVCGCPIGTIRSRVARARADLLRAADADRSHTG